MLIIPRVVTAAMKGEQHDVDEPCAFRTYSEHSETEVNTSEKKGEATEMEGAPSETKRAPTGTKRKPSKMKGKLSEKKREPSEMWANPGYQFSDPGPRDIEDAYGPSSDFRELERHGKLSELTIWEVARAVVAAPKIFKAMKIGGHLFIDGGFMSNNPSVEIFGDVLGANGRVDTLVSLGTGNLGKSKADFFKPGVFGLVTPHVRTVTKLRGVSTDGEYAHEAMQRLADSIRTEYYRFNVILDRKEWRLDSWRKPRTSVFKHLERIVDNHLKQPGVRDSLRDCAKTLVERRRLRAFDVAAWENFSA